MTEETKQENCETCIDDARNKLVAMGLAACSCAMLPGSDDRKSCEEKVKELNDSGKFDDVKAMGELFADIIASGDADVTERLIDMINQRQAEYFIAGVDILRERGVPVSTKAETFYTVYSHALEKKKAEQSKPVKEIALQ